MSTTLKRNSHVVLVSGSPSLVRLCRSCLRHFGDLKKPRSWNFGVCILWIFGIFVDFRAPQALCSCVAAACGALAPSEKTRLWSFGVCICGFYHFVNDFRAPLKPFAAVSQLPAALRRFLKNDAPGLFEHVYCQFSRCSLI